MESDPGRIIRAIRLALGMTQAEFGRAVGWSPSTISRWESGRDRPSRLALKIILAFAQERGVRYRPRRHAGAALPVPGGDSTGAAPPRLAHPGRPQRPALEPEVLQPTPAPGMEAPRPRWAVELSFRLAPRGPCGEERRASGSWRRAASVVVVGMCALAAGTLALSAGVPSPPPAFRAESDPAHESTAPRSRAAAHPTPRPATAPDAPAPSLEPSTAAPSPRHLRGVMLVGKSRRATFGTAAQAVSVTEGGWVGAWRVAQIRRDGVELRDRAGSVRTIRIGQAAPPY